MCPACLEVAGRARAERWEVVHSPLPAEGHLPADVIFVYPGCAQPVPARSAGPGPGPAQEARPPATAGRAAGRRGRGGDRRVEVVRCDRAVGRRCRPGGAGGAGRGARPGGGVPRSGGRFALVSADTLDRVLGAWLHTRAVAVCGRLVIAVFTARPSAARRTRTGVPRTWSRRWRTGSARSLGRSPWRRSRTKSPRCASL